MRLDVKSTQLETRIATFQQVATATGGKVPIPLLYCGAITSGRDSGTDNMNAQNLPRINPNEPKPGRPKRREEWVDSAWALINSTEFLHHH